MQFTIFKQFSIFLLLYFTLDFLNDPFLSMN